MLAHKSASVSVSWRFGFKRVSPRNHPRKSTPKSNPGDGSPRYQPFKGTSSLLSGATGTLPGTLQWYNFLKLSLILVQIY
jgi:hypothetical protein